MGKVLPIADSVHRVKMKASRVRRVCRSINNERIKSHTALAAVTELCESYYDRLFALLIPDMQRKVAAVYCECKELLEMARSLRRSFKYARARHKAEEALHKLKTAFANLPFNFQIGWSEVMLEI